MKKGLFALSLLLLLLVGTNKVSAAESVLFTEPNIYNSFVVKKSSFQDITDYTDSELVKETKPDGSIVYYSEHVGANYNLERYGEWFKKINGKLVNYKETYETGRKTKYEKIINNIQEIEYYVDITKCKSDTDIVNDNCQSKYMKKLIEASYYLDEVNSKFVVSYNTNNKYSRNDAYSKTEFYGKDDYGKLNLESKVIVSRNAVNKITKVKVEGELVDGDGDAAEFGIFETGKIDKRDSNSLYDVNNLKVYTVVAKTQDDKKRVVKYVETNMNQVDIYTKNIAYFSNNKQRFAHVVKRSENNKITYTGKLRNYSNSRKRGYIKYNYKNGIVGTRYEYVYNKKGNLKGSAYRYKTTYNKKGKKLKSYKSYYNKKGKIYKTKKTKHRKDFK